MKTPDAFEDGSRWVIRIRPDPPSGRTSNASPVASLAFPPVKRPDHVPRRSPGWRTVKAHSTPTSCSSCRIVAGPSYLSTRHHPPAAPYGEALTACVRAWLPVSGSGSVGIPALMRKLAYNLGEAGLVILTPVAFVLVAVWISLLAYLALSLIAGLLGGN